MKEMDTVEVIVEKEKYVEEKLDVTQGKLVIGYDVILDEEEHIFSYSLHFIL